MNHNPNPFWVSADSQPVQDWRDARRDASRVVAIFKKENVDHPPNFGPGNVTRTDVKKSF